MDEKVDSAAKDAEGAKGGRTTSSAAIGNVSKVHRERLLAEVAAIKSFLEQSGDKHATRLLSFAADLEKEVRGKKFGLIFEEHRERVDAELEANIPVLEEVKERFISHGGTEAQGALNFLIEGDNLAALKLLEKTHRGKIDLIYIDPPYNTGNEDFIYNDSYVDKTDTFRHSKWLSFMRKRLEIAKQLMSDKGVIFISIDDNEQAALKLLCDTLFMEENVETMVWHKVDNDSGRLKVTHRFRREHEYVLVIYKYKDHTRFTKFLKRRNYKNKYSNPDNDPRGPYKQGIISDTEEKSAKGSDNYYSVTTPGGKVYTRRWRFPKTEFEALDADNRIYYGKKGDAVPALKVFINEPGLATPISILEELGTAKTAGQELKELFNDEMVFLYPKPVALILHLLQISSSQDSTILDFFAGSGTTGHAVMKLNAEDGGKRKFILVTNNENDICEKVTYERLKRVMEKEGYAASLKYFKIGFVPIGEEGYWDLADALLGHIRELVELENGIDFDHDNSVAIVQTDEELGEFLARISTQRRKGAEAANPRILYKGHNVILGAKAKKELERRGVRVETIPDYYYPELEG